MRNKSQMAVAVRKPDGEIEVGVDEYHGIGEKTIWARLPLVRGVLSFVDSLQAYLQKLAVEETLQRYLLIGYYSNTTFGYPYLYIYSYSALFYSTSLH